MPDIAHDLARRLGGAAEAVCRHYLSNGRRHGRYWLVGDVENTPGRSLYVRLHGSEHGRGAAGKWTDAATGEHGDLLDLIAANRRLSTLADTLNEARSFLSLPPPERHEDRAPAPTGSPEAARRLLAASKPVGGTLAETYLRARGITAPLTLGPLRFHPRCFYRPDEDEAPRTRTAWPALVAAVTDPRGKVTGAHRTWLDPAGGKAPVATQRRAMGDLLGHAVRFGVPRDTLAVGEGIETVLSLRSICPTLPTAAALSAGHLGAVVLPDSLRRLYVALDNDAAGHRSADILAARATEAGIGVIRLMPISGDFNDDLRRRGRDALAAAVRVQLAPEDVERFLTA